MQISERTINTTLNQLADTYEHGPPVYCFATLNKGDPNNGDTCCVLGHLSFMLTGSIAVDGFGDVGKILGHGGDSSIFYDAMNVNLARVTQKEAAVALRKYAQAYHPVPDKVALVIVKPQALAA